LDADIWGSIFLFIILIIFSAFFSGSESAYFSLSQIDLRRLREDQEKTARIRRILKLMENPKRLLMAILIGNTVVNVAAATVAALLTNRFLMHGSLGNGWIMIEIVVVTLVILVLSEVSPKVFAVKQSVRFAKQVSLPLSGFVMVLTPVSVLFEKAVTAISTVFRIQKESPFIDQEAFKTLFQVGEDKGALDRTEREMIHSIFEFRETTAKEIMVPRMDMICVEKETPIETLLTLVREKGHSRIPVYDDKVDNIIGILYVKDLLPHMRDKTDVHSLANLVRKTYFVPESKMIDELLKDFQRERNHMAIVVDEYGGTAGLITLEDVIEEIVGEIRDEYDKEISLIKKVEKGVWLIEAKINIEELNEALGSEIPSAEDYESLGGFIFSQLGHIPQEKEEVTYDNLKLIVEKVQGQRINKVRIIQQENNATAESHVQET